MSFGAHNEIQLDVAFQELQNRLPEYCNNDSRMDILESAIEHINCLQEQLAAPQVYQNSLYNDSQSNHNDWSTLEHVSNSYQYQETIHNHTRFADQHQPYQVRTFSSPVKTFNARDSKRCCWEVNGEQCNAVFVNSEFLTAHLDKRHFSEHSRKCLWMGCDKEFKHRYRLVNHMRVHTGLLPFKCHLCSQSFTRSENLQIHVRTHTGEKPYKCLLEGCEKRFPSSSDRGRHMKRHSGNAKKTCGDRKYRPLK